MESRELTRDYVAGLFDGEGYIGLTPYHSKTKTTYVLRVALVNTDRRPLDDCAAMFGGTVYQMKDKRPRKPAWMWGVNSRIAQAFLEWVRPALHVKADQAWMALEFMAHMGPVGKPLSDEARALQEGFYLALKETKN